MSESILSALHHQNHGIQGGRLLVDDRALRWGEAGVLLSREGQDIALEGSTIQLSQAATLPERGGWRRLFGLRESPVYWLFFELRGRGHAPVRLKARVPSARVLEGLPVLQGGGEEVSFGALEACILALGADGCELARGVEAQTSLPLFVLPPLRSAQVEVLGKIWGLLLLLSLVVFVVALTVPHWSPFIWLSGLTLLALSLLASPTDLVRYLNDARRGRSDFSRATAIKKSRATIVAGPSCRMRPDKGRLWLEEKPVLPAEKLEVVPVLTRDDWCVRLLRATQGGAPTLGIATVHPENIERFERQLEQACDVGETPLERCAAVTAPLASSHSLSESIERQEMRHRVLSLAGVCGIFTGLAQLSIKQLVRRHRARAKVLQEKGLAEPLPKVPKRAILAVLLFLGAWIGWVFLWRDHWWLSSRTPEVEMLWVWPMVFPVIAGVVATWITATLLTKERWRAALLLLLIPGGMGFGGLVSSWTLPYQGRFAGPLEWANQSGRSLDGVSLDGAPLHEARLMEASLRGAQLEGAALQDAILADADLREASMRGACLQDAHLDGADLRGADLREAYLQAAVLTGADLRGAKLSGAYLQGADLSGAMLDDGVLEQVILNEETVLPDGRSGEKLGREDRSQDDMKKVNWRGHYAPQLSRFTQADFSGADLRGAYLPRASFGQATLSGADLSCAYLRGAQLTQASLQDANLEGALLSDAVLIQAHLDRANLNGAYFRHADLTQIEAPGASLKDADLSFGRAIQANFEGADTTGLHDFWLTDTQAHW